MKSKKKKNEIYGIAAAAAVHNNNNNHHDEAKDVDDVHDADDVVCNNPAAATLAKASLNQFGTWKFHYSRQI